MYKFYQHSPGQTLPKHQTIMVLTYRSGYSKPSDRCYGLRLNPRFGKSCIELQNVQVSDTTKVK